MKKASKFGEMFREKFHYEGKLTRKEMGPELWNEYYKILQKNKIKSEKHKKELEERKIARKTIIEERAKLREAMKRLNGEHYKKYCKTPELIENFYEAQKENFKGWVLHHKLEQMFTSKELIMMNIYYDCKPGELIFLPISEHNNNMRLHLGCRLRNMSKNSRKRKIVEVK